MFNFSLRDLASNIYAASTNYLAGAPIEFSLPHSLSKDEVKNRIVGKTDLIPSEFMPRLKWDDYCCSFSGSAEGTLKIEEHEVKIDLKLSPACGLFHDKLESELPKTMQLLLDA